MVYLLLDVSVGFRINRLGIAVLYSDITSSTKRVTTGLHSFIFILTLLGILGTVGKPWDRASPWYQVACGDLPAFSRYQQLCPRGLKTISTLQSIPLPYTVVRINYRV